MSARRFLPALVFCLLIGALIPTSPSLSAPASPSDLIASLRAQTSGRVRLSYHAETGKVRFLGTDNDHPIARPSLLSANATAEQAARQFLGTYGSLFGIQNQADELKVMQQEAADGHSFVRFQQVYKGIPVLAGELIVQTDKQRNIVSANGEVLPDLKVDTTPQIDAATATERALGAIAKEYRIRLADLKASAPELWIFNPALLGGPGLRRNTLTWRLELRGLSAGEAIRELVLVDAQLGAVTLNFNQINDAKERHICNDNNVVDADGDPDNDCTPPKYVRNEGGPPTGVADVNLAYDYSGLTYDFYKNNFNRDSLNGAGLPLISLVKYCPDAAHCPYENAFWDGHQMTYGDGYASADDVVGHELSHGFTEFTSHLFYYYQSGAINESMSDVFGELIDLTDGVGNDSPSARWQLGEDLSIGAVRNMKDPTIAPFGDPDRTGSSNYYGGALDSGGVHSNSGVNNKAAYLMTDGDTFNGQTITGLGTAKVAQIYYKVETSFLTSGSDYQDLGDDLKAACSYLISTHSITSADCAQVAKVVLATEMDQTPTNAPATDAPFCSGALSPFSTFSDDLENTASGNWASSATAGVNTWFYPATSNPFVFDATYATSGVNNFWGYDQGGTLSQPTTPADFNIRMTKSVAVPANAFMHFKHAYGFENGSSATYDGGVVEYSINGGASWTDAGSLFLDNGYNGTIDNGFDNPLAGLPAFVAVSKGYISSRLNLASLAGQSVRFRFRIGTDSSGEDYGWFIDDVNIYTCKDASTFTNKTYLPLIVK
jgi:bacillolysin